MALIIAGFVLLSAQEAAAGHPHRDSIGAAVAGAGRKAGYRAMPAAEEEEDEVEAEEAEKEEMKEEGDVNQARESESLARP